MDQRRRKVDGDEINQSRTYIAQRLLGKGSFGVVYQAQVLETNEIVAIKSIHTIQEKDRETQILKELEGHPNIVQMKGSFSCMINEKEKRHNLVLEFVPDTVHRVIKHYNVIGKPMDAYYVRLYSYQLVRALSFIHGLGIVHADVKPQNLLLEGKSHTVKLCDFGTAKRIAYGEPSRPYMCSRYYRAPECILGSTTYNTAIDLWAAGCVCAELLLGQPLFTGKDGVCQLVEIIRVLGTPTSQDLRAMSPCYPSYEFTPRIQPHSWDVIFKSGAKEDAIDIVDNLLRYDPNRRIKPLNALAHRFYDPLRAQESVAHARLFNFTESELFWATPLMKESLVPRWMAKFAAAAANKQNERAA